MRYAYHFEFCEHPQLPKGLRTQIFTTLSFIESQIGLPNLLLSELAPLLKGYMRVVEMGSGSGELTAHLARALPDTEFWMTDLYPHQEVWAKHVESAPNLRAHGQSLSFENAGSFFATQTRERTAVLCISAFHHIKGSEARAFLEQAAAHGVDAFVVEPLRRNLGHAFLGFAGGLLALAAPLKRRGFTKTMQSMLTHWALPVVPAILAHDGVVSALRQRTSTDWAKLTDGLGYSVTHRHGLGAWRNFSITSAKSIPLS